MDIFTKEKRSEIMSHVRSSGTGPERLLYPLLKSILRNTRIVRNDGSIAGTPDFYVPFLQLAIFVDGCFFHGCTTHCRLPKSNTQFWQSKIQNNIIRDKRVDGRLRRSGIGILRFWGHELKVSKLQIVKSRVEMAVTRRRALMEKRRIKKRIKRNGIGIVA
jgi:DNA mismatch endonuclease, patch repair protein